MSKNTDPYSGAKSVIVLAIVSYVASLFLPVLSLPLGIQSYTIFDLMDLSDVSFPPFALFGIIGSIVLLMYSYVKIEDDERIQYYLMGAAALILVPIIQIMSFKNEVDEITGIFLEVSLLNYSMGFFALIIGIVFNVIAITSLPSEEDLSSAQQPTPTMASAPAQPSHSPQPAKPAKPLQDTSIPSSPTANQSSNPQQQTAPKQFCGTCGTKQSGNDAYCPNCGSKL